MGTRLGVLVFCLLQWAGAALAAEVSVPIALDYGIVRQALARQVFVGPDGSVELFNDGFDCNALRLSDPQVSSTDDGYLSVRTKVDARFGTPVNGRCLVPVSWQGDVETLQEVFVALDGQSVGFRVMDSNIITSGAQSSPVPGLVWDWLKAYVHPRLARVTIELGTTLESLQGLLGAALQAPTATEEGVLSSLVLQGVEPGTETLDISLRFDAPDLPEDWLPEEGAVLSDEELAQWTAAWQSWDSFATWLVKMLAMPADPELADALGETLLDARYDLHEALAREQPGPDPVRELFTKTWDRLAPMLRDGRLAVPGVDGLQLATFISAADALRTLDSVAPHLGMRFDSETFRRLARLILPTVTEADLGYDTSVDPFLRMLFGFDPEMDSGAEAGTIGPLGWLIPGAQAAPADAALVKKLTGWVPARNDLDEYLASVARLLESVIAAERDKGKVPSAFASVHEDLMLATAWQESCWRQYIDRNGVVQTLRSSAGSLGLMQVNQYVWRGVYDLAALKENIAYNARAGNEILVHYLVDYALARGENDERGGADNLARAAYAAYNGGPRHLSRYRNPQTGEFLASIDAAFWEKYRAIGAQGAEAVRSCYGI